MSEIEHLDNAPIVEALLDIHVKLPKKTKSSDLEAVQSSLKSGFPLKQLRKTWQSETMLRPDAAPLTKTSEASDSIQFLSADQKQVIQARLESYSYSRLQPYTDWEDFSETAKAGWKAYCKILRPESIDRIALRYINRLPLPLPFSDLSDYVRTGPRLSPDLPLSLKAFFFRVVTHEADAKATVIVTETIEEPKGTSLHIPLIFDIDVFRVGSFPKDPEKLWELFPPLRDIKNRVFFSSLTPAAKDLFR